MRCCCLVLLIAVACAEEKTHPLDRDDDGDGFSEFDGDCADNDRNTFPGAAERDSPDACMTDVDDDGWGRRDIGADRVAGLEAGTDCDDGQLTLGSVSENHDCDAFMTAEDCDDENASMPRDDADCDGVVTTEDCNDQNASMPLEDEDCDGVVTADDCDDGDEALGAVAADADCDGVLTAADCDDGDGSSTVVASDGDCDGVLTAADCDDGDEALGAVAADGDCDGVLSRVDCDDGDGDSTVVATDGDCDGVLTAADCDDSDGDSTVVATDGDCDGVLTAADCDDGDGSSTVVATDGDCDGVLTAADCDDGDGSSTVVATDGDCDGVLTAADCDDTDATMPLEDADCDGVLTSDDCDDSDPENFPDGEGCPARSCLDLLEFVPAAEDGVYWLDPTGSSSFDAYCDMTSFGGGWTLVAQGESGDFDGWNTSAAWTSEGSYKLADSTINALITEDYWYRGTGTVEGDWFFRSDCVYNHTAQATGPCVCPRDEVDDPGTESCSASEPGMNGLADWQPGAGTRSYLFTNYGSGEWMMRDTWSDYTWCDAADPGCDVELYVR